MRIPVSILLLFSAHGVLSQTEKPALSPRVVDVYKAGYAFVVSEGRVAVTGGIGIISPIPDASFGTIWFGATDRAVRIDGIKAVESYRKTTRPCRTLAEILRQQIGRRIVWRQFGNEMNLAGTLERVADSGDRLLVDIKAGAQSLTIPVSGYSDYFEFPDGRISTMTDSIKQEHLEIRTDAAAPFQLQMVYLQRGIGWTPSYRVDLLDDKNAQIILSANLLNDALDLENTELNFVVGFPHFMYSHVETPLTMRQSITEFLNALGGSESGYRPNYQRSVLANQSVMYEMGEEAYAPDFTNFKALEGSSEEDLFLYNIKNITLMKGERGQFNIFSARVPYQHIYEVSLPSGLRDDVYFAENRETTFPVWHSVKLENNTANPWTTGSVITFQKGKSLGQDVLNYAPMKASTNVKITQSPDIRVTEEEKETARNENVKKKDGYYYNEVTIDGEITVQNFKNRAIRLTLNRPVTGVIKKISDKPVVTQKTSLYKAMNARNEVAWEVEVKAGETKKITYQYQALIRQ